MRSPSRLATWSDPALSPDGKNLWVRAETEDGRSLDLEMPLDQIGDFVSFFTSVANFLVRQRADQDGEPLRTATADWAPIPVVGVGLGAGGSPDKTILFVRLAGFELAFSLDSDKVSEVGRDFARMAHTLSSGDGKPQ